jgi:acetyl esterase/lipase
MPHLDFATPTDVSWVRNADGMIRCHAGETATLVYLHGGGWVGGSSRAHRGTLAALAEACHADAFSIDYRLAPAWPIRLALEDCAKAYAAIRPQAKRLLLIGESAGAALALRLMADGADPPDGLVLISPVADLDRRHGPLKGQSKLIDWGVRALRPIWFDRGDPPADWSNLPTTSTPALVISGTADPLKCDARYLAAQLSAQLLEYPRMPHGFFSLSRLFPAARRAVADIGAWAALVP